MREYTSTPQETKAYYVSELSNYKTASSKKAFLTRSLKQAEAWHDDLVKAYQRQSRMLHGEKVNLIDIRIAEAELRTINNIYSTL